MNDKTHPSSKDVYDPPPRYTCFVEGCPSNHVSKWQVCGAAENWADRYQVIKDSFWWRVKTGTGMRLAGKFHTEKGAQQMASEMLTAFMDGKLVGEEEVEALAGENKRLKIMLEATQGALCNLHERRAVETKEPRCDFHNEAWCEFYPDCPCGRLEQGSKIPDTAGPRHVHVSGICMPGCPKCASEKA